MIEIKNISKTFKTADGNVEALKNVSLNINDGDIYGIIGMSGAGKSQVVRTLEDFKFFCIDNLPAALIPKFAELCRQTDENNIANVVFTLAIKDLDDVEKIMAKMRTVPGVADVYRGSY